MRVSCIWHIVEDGSPIVDILVEVTGECNMEDIKAILLQNGYLCMNQSKNRITFNKGYTENGFAEKVFHLHLRYEGDNAEIYFRDYLTQNPQVAHKYEKMKLSLWKEYEYDRDGYTDAKTEFVAKYTELAKKELKKK